MIFSATDRQAFWSRVNKNGPVPAHKPELGPCWLWTGWIEGKGYGGFYAQGKHYRAHRIAYYFAHRRFPEPNGLHKCDNRLCVRDTHVFEGTQADNVADMNTKGRARGAIGSQNGYSKLTESQIKQIRKRATQGEAIKSLLLVFKVSKGCIYRIISGKTWRHVL